MLDEIRTGPCEKTGSISNLGDFGVKVNQATISFDMFMYNEQIHYG